jgi:hypothetical protein
VTEKSKRGHREAQEGLERLQREKERLQRGLERMQSGGNREVIERLQRGHREDEKRHGSTHEYSKQCQLNSVLALFLKALFTHEVLNSNQLITIQTDEGLNR